MSLNTTPAAERIHIGFFGRRNAGKSSLINAITGQDLAIVSDVAGTTTDPVYKAMELLPLGPVMLVDTPGIDDEGELGKKRVRKSYQALNKTDIALVVIDGKDGITGADAKLIERIKQKGIPHIVVRTKSDISDIASNEDNEISVSAANGDGIHELKEMIARQNLSGDSGRQLVGDLISPGDLLILVVPIDKAAPKGRLILPQQQTIRDILDSDAVSIISTVTQLESTLKSIGKKPKLVITDSQVFKDVSPLVPPDIMLTSFSILFARYKGELEPLAKGAAALDSLRDGDKILIAEGCTHHRQCDDIGTYKLPKWIRKYTGKELRFEYVSGADFPDDLSQYGLILHCGGCMLHQREVKYRLACASDQGVPITNYGVLIAHMNGILERSLEPFSGAF